MDMHVFQVESNKVLPQQGAAGRKKQNRINLSNT